MMKISTRVEWDNYDGGKLADRADRQAFEVCISEYIDIFSSLPPVGLRVDGGTCDPGEIEFITFSVDEIFVWLKFD